VKRVLIVGGVVVVAALAVGVWLLLSNLDSLVASVIEEQGSAVTGTSVRVGSVSIDLRGGSGTIRGLRVANPDGFSRGDAFSLGEITLDLDTGSLTGSPIVVERVRVAEPAANYEVDARGRSNFGALKSNVERYSAAGGAAEEAPAAEGEPLKLLIRDFAFEKGSVRADFSALDADQEPIQAELPTVRRSNLGAPSGAAPGQIGKQVLGAFTGAVVKTVGASQAARQLEDRIGGEAGKAAGGLLKKMLD
jgi:hypothetical protein